jgi:phage-related holin
MGQYKKLFYVVALDTLFEIVSVVETDFNHFTNYCTDGSAVRTAVIFFYLSNEGISILENASLIGLPIPERLQEVLAQLSGKGDE